MNAKNLKGVLGKLVYSLSLHKLFLINKAVVVTFHRVNDSIEKNPITCEEGLFEEFCVFFKSHFNVISLSELLDRLESKRSISGCLVITFDDGYLDNFEIAAPILRRHHLPACFFIASDFIGTDKITAWDREWGIKSEWMTWDNVRFLSSEGFEIGAHTKNHVDLGLVEGKDALEEIQGSRKALEEELNRKVDLFSFPFGRENQLSESNRALVKELNFRCSPSAYGGIVKGSSDPFRMRRQPVSPWHESVWQFGFEVLREDA